MKSTTAFYCTLLLANVVIFGMNHNLPADLAKYYAEKEYACSIDDVNRLTVTKQLDIQYTKIFDEKYRLKIDINFSYEFAQLVIYDAKNCRVAEAQAFPNNSRFPQNHFFIAQLSTQEAHRKRGLATIILNELCNLGLQKGYQTMYLVVHNKEAQRFYEKRGFVCQAGHTTFFNARVMNKQLLTAQVK